MVCKYGLWTNQREDRKQSSELRPELEIETMLRTLGALPEDKLTTGAVRKEGRARAENKSESTGSQPLSQDETEGV
jgi:hypothetical protein